MKLYVPTQQNVSWKELYGKISVDSFMTLISYGDPYECNVKDLIDRFQDSSSDLLNELKMLGIVEETEASNPINEKVL